MRRSRWLLAPLALVAACGSTSSGGDSSKPGDDAGSSDGGGGEAASSSGGGILIPPVDGGHDAATTQQGGADAGTLHDAGEGTDGTTHAPGDSGTSGSDSGTPGTDSGTPGSDGGTQGTDAGATCVGTWTMIPSLTVGGAPVAKYDVMTSDGATVYVAYSRPSDTTYFDVASYTQAGGWQAYQSATPDDPTTTGQRPEWAMPETGHLAGFSMASDSTIWREVFDYTTQTWTYTSTNTLQPQRSGIAFTKDWLVFEGEYLSPGQNMCETLPDTVVFTLDATNTTPPPQGNDSSLGSLTAPYSIATADHVFFFGGYSIPADSSGCNITEPRTLLYNAAFYDPETNVWSTAVPLGAPNGSSFVSFRFAALPGGQVVVFENYTDIFGRANLLAPGQTSFTATAALPSGLWNRMVDTTSYATLAGTAAGVVVWSTPSNDGVLYDPSSNTMTPICAPPGAVANTFMASTPDGVVLLGDGQTGTGSTTAQSAYLTF